MFRLRPHRVVATLLLSGFATGMAHAQPQSAAAQTSQTTQPQNQAETQAQTQDDRPIASRADQLAREQAARALTSRPYQPTGFEKAVDLAEDLVLNPPRVYPWFGSIYPGGLFALGGGVRQPFGDTGLFDVHGGWSFRNYTGVSASLRLPQLADGKVKFDLHGNVINAPSVLFTGIGQDTPNERSFFKYSPMTAGAGVTISPVKYFNLGAAADYLKANTGTAKRDPLEERFDLIDAPGLGEDPTYLVTKAFAEIDWRTSPGYTDRGGLYRVDWSDYSQSNDTLRGYSFRRLDADIRQFIPLMRANWVIALRGLVSTTYTSGNDVVPFYLMPDLGGGGDLRGYQSFRFRDRHKLLLSGEYRWKAGQFVDMALFVDAGKVTADRSDLNFKDLQPAYGVGVRFHAPSATMLRIDVAKTREGVGVVFTAGNIF
jgi:Omp85 superfamily domain